MELLQQDGGSTGQIVVSGVEDHPVVMERGLMRTPHRLVGCERVFLSQAVIVDRITASVDGPSHGQQSSLHCIP
eukprot:2923217-Pleurochrysis_carterae.AAC.1